MDVNQAMNMKLRGDKRYRSVQPYIEFRLDSGFQCPICSKQMQLISCV
jgi:hypothetical protein